MSEIDDERLAWLAEFGPRGTGETVAAATEAMQPATMARSLPAAAPVAGDAVAGADTVPMPSSSILIGSDAEATMELDQAVAEALGNPARGARSLGDFRHVVEKFKDSPLTGCTSVMDMALTRSGWNPLDPRQAGNYDRFLTYVTILTQTPFFRRPPQRTTNLIQSLQYNDPKALAVQVAYLLPDATPADRARVASTIVHMAHAVFTGSDGSNRAQESLFVQHAMTVTDRSINVNLYWSQVYMEYDQKARKSSVSRRESSSLSVERFCLVFPTDSWSKYAKAVAREKITLVSQWLRKTTIRF